MFWHVDWNEFRMRYILQCMFPFVLKLGSWPVYVVLGLSLSIAYLLSVTEFCILQSMFTFFLHTQEHSLMGWVGVTILMFDPFQKFLKQTILKFLRGSSLVHIIIKCCWHTFLVAWFTVYTVAFPLTWVCCWDIYNYSQSISFWTCNTLVSFTHPGTFFIYRHCTFDTILYVYWMWIYNCVWFLKCGLFPVAFCL